MAEARCYLYDIVEPRPATIKSDHWLGIERLMDESGWAGELGRRFGVVDVARHDVIIAGLFANEGPKRGVQYDENKQPIEAEKLNSFEHLFFTIFTDTAQLLLQQRNVYGYVDLSLPVLRQNLLLLLADYFRLAGVRVTTEGVKIEPAGEEHTHEELFRVLTESRAVRFAVAGLNQKRIPGRDDPRYILYNPKGDWNEITWQVISETINSGARKTEVSADEEDPAASLGESGLSRALATSGELQEVAVREPSGRIQVMRRTSDEEISIDLPAEPEIALPVLDRILDRFDAQSRQEARLRRDERRLRDETRGTLFDRTVDNGND
jgi:hypothetical protein